MGASLADRLSKLYVPRVRYSLKLLLGVPLVVGLCCTWFSRQLSLFRSEREAIEFLNCEESVYLSGQTGLNSFVDEPQWSFSEIRHGRLYVPINEVFVPNRSINSDFWKHLKAFRHLASLKLQNCRLPLESQQSLAYFSCMQVLDITDTDLTVSHLRQIAKMRQLRELLLVDVGATDEWMPIIANMTGLEQLDLEGDITDKGVASLSTLSLRGLSLPNTAITSKSAEVIRCFRQLERLNVANTRIDDNFIENLGILPDLTQLVLENTDITDKGTEFLSRYPKLHYLSLSKTRITSAALIPLSRIATLRRDLLMADSTFVDAHELAKWRSVRNR